MATANGNVLQETNNKSSAAGAAAGAGKTHTKATKVAKICKTIYHA